MVMSKLRLPALVLFAGALVSAAAMAEDLPAPAPAAAAAVQAPQAPQAPQDDGAPAAASEADAPIEGCGVGEAPPSSLDERLKAMLGDALDSGNLLFALLLVLLAGFGVTLTPCVYPLIPITLSIFGARGSPSKVQGFLLSSTYVGGMVLLYSSLGIGFALAGKMMGGAMQSPWVTAGVALFCLAMAASMFGAFELALPQPLQNRLSQMGGSGYKGAFIMGLVAGLIAAPCTGPVLTFILTLIARDGDVAKGGLFMVVFSVGVGIPFLVLGTFSTAISRIPKSGPWTEAVKSVFGLLMIGAGLYFLSLGVPAVKSAIGGVGDLGLYLGPVLLVAGALIGALHLSFKYTPTAEKLRKATGLVFAVTAVVAFVGWAVGGPVGEAVKWQKVATEQDALERFDAALEDAKAQGHPVMIDFFAEWCAACKELDKFTYSDPAVRAEAERFVSVKVDATEDTEALTELQKRYGIVGLPTVVFVNAKGQTCKRPRVTGFVEAEAYLPLMRSVF